MPEKGFKTGILDVGAYLTRRHSLFVTFMFPQIHRNRILRHSRSYSFVNAGMLSVQVKYHFKKTELQLQLMVWSSKHFQTTSKVLTEIQLDALLQHAAFQKHCISVFYRHSVGKTKGNYCEMQVQNMTPMSRKKYLQVPINSCFVLEINS